MRCNSRPRWLRRLQRCSPTACPPCSRRSTASSSKGSTPASRASTSGWRCAARELRTRLAAAHAGLLQAYRERSEPNAAIGSALRLLALEPLREDVHRVLMELLTEQRQYGAALRQYQLCRDVLARELGVRPQSATVQLRDAIERRRALAAGEAASWFGDPVASTSAELRHVALLAVESLHAAAESDPEQAQTLSDAADSIAADAVERFGGSHQQRPGGGLLGCFGLPAGHADDDERAARCALSLVEGCPEMRIGLAAGLVLTAPQPEGRLGLHSGGEVAGLASRLFLLPVPEMCWLPKLCGVDSLRASTASAMPMHGCRPRCAAQGSAGSSQCGPIRSGERCWSVGHAELAQFGTLIDSCVAERVGSLVHLRGEAGIGKTRLAEEFRNIAAARGFGVHQGRVLDFGSSAERDAVRSLVLDLLGLNDSARAAAIESAIASAVALGEAQPADELALFALLRQSPPQRLRAIDDAMDSASRTRAALAALSTWPAAARNRPRCC